jgi:23S rRNA (guanine745-N1)-methyltransferase
MNRPILLCPVCNAPLEASAATFCCAAGHSFDPAKEGYLNLLLSHQRRSNHPGDDPQMVHARRRFLDSGAYDPLKQLLGSAASGPAILDCGCGEGSFLAALSGNLFGMDISKEAIRSAAKRYPHIRWIVANALRPLPFADHSMDTLVSLLAPRNPPEFARVLKPDGALLLGVPGPHHLIELRSRLATQVDDFEEKADEAAAKCSPHLTERHRTALSYEQTLRPAQLADLVQMTPLFWCSSPAAKAALGDLPELKVTVSFTLLTLTPRSGG